MPYPAHKSCRAKRNGASEVNKHAQNLFTEKDFFKAKLDNCQSFGEENYFVH